MPSQQFQRLAAGKRHKINQALFHEFTAYSLADAQVARIVKEAGIARGAFYNYFADLTDAYSYLFGIEMQRIHRPLGIDSGQILSAAEYVRQAKSFLKEVEQCQLRQLFIFHFQTNAGLLMQEKSHHNLMIDTERTPTMWAVATLIHQAINDAILDPSKEDFILQRLQQALTQLEGVD